MKNLVKKLKSLDKGTICRTILQGVAYINQFVAVLGYSTFASSPVYQWVTFGLTIVTTLVSYWYNNDWTDIAKTTGEIYDMLADGKMDLDEINKFVNEHKQDERRE